MITLTSFDTTSQDGSSIKLFTPAGTFPPKITSAGDPTEIACREIPRPTHLADLRNREHLPLSLGEILLIQSLAFACQDLFKGVRRIISRSFPVIFVLRDVTRLIR